MDLLSLAGIDHILRQLESCGLCLVMRGEDPVTVARDAGVQDEIPAHPLPILLLTRCEGNQVALIFSYDGSSSRILRHRDPRGRLGETGVERHSRLDNDQPEFPFDREARYSN